MKGYFLIFLFFFSFSSGQNSNDLVLKIKENQKLMKSEMERGFQELKTLEKTVVLQQNVDAQLEVLNNKAFYYFTKAEYNKAYKIAKELEEKATAAKNIRLIAIAKNRLGVTLNFLQVHDESEKKLKEAEQFIDENDFQDKNLIRANNYQFQSDLYTHILKHDKAVAYIKKTILEYEKIKNLEERKNQLAKGNGNIGLKFLSVDLDSAAHYFKKSLAIQDKIEAKNFNVANYTGLGEVYNRKNEHKKAVEYLKKAEELNEKVQDGFYMTSIYELLQDSYKNLGNEKEYEKYKLRYLENLKIENEEKLSGVKTFVDEVKAQSEEAIKENRNKTFLIIVIGMVALSFLIFIFYSLRKISKKKKEKSIIELQLVEKEKKIENLENKISDLHSEVIELAQQNSPQFYSRFLDLYPEFEKNILELNPKISISEIQFCALLKLNFSSKDIANYTFTSIRTVQNKKYRIRNKFNIPKEVDTYVFINNL